MFGVDKSYHSRLYLFGIATIILVLMVTIRVSGAQELTVDKRLALPFPPGVTLHSQCGVVNDQQDVEFYKGNLGVSRSYSDKHEPSTIQIQWRQESEILAKLPNYEAGNVANERWCSGTLISDRHILTAGHCFDIQNGDNYWVSPYTIDSNNMPIFAQPEVIAQQMVVNFGYQVNGETGQVRKADVYPIVILHEHTNKGSDLDYAVIEVGQNAEGNLPESKYQAATLKNRDIVEGEILVVIQHPQGKPKKIEAGPAKRSSGPWMYYSNLDTHGGSSGSGVRDENGHVVGVHTNGGCCMDGSGANRGVTLKAIAPNSVFF